MAVDRHELKEHWLNRALERAGIERVHWRPELGVDQNRRTVEAVYGYYGRLFVEHPHLKWAGLANMVGPALVAGGVPGSGDVAGVAAEITAAGLPGLALLSVWRS